MSKNICLTLGSLFDGSGGFPLAGILCGITPIWASEIEPFPIRVTTKRLPGVKHYGDISKINGGEIEPVDIITFGSPCQDMSVAGKRSGLDGDRSCLFYEAIRIIKEMRCKTNGQKPRYIVWENVPGAFSSNKGEDFKAVLDEIIRIKEPSASVPMPEKGGWAYADTLMGDGWSVAYRVLDAQYFGVPQRRRRIFLVADFAGECASQILFEQEGLSWDTPPSRVERQSSAGRSEEGTHASGYDGYNGTLTNDVSATLGVNCGMSTGRNGIVLNDQGGNRMDITEDYTATLRAEAHHPPCVMEAAGFCTEHSSQSRSIGYEDERSPTLRAGVVPAAIALENHPTDSRIKIEEDNKVQTLTSRMGTGGNNVPLLMDNVQKAYGICSKDSNSMKSRNPNSGIYEADTSRTLDATGGNPSCNQGGIAVVSVQGSMIGRSNKNGPQGSGVGEDVSFTLNATDKHAVAYGIDRAAFNQGKNAQFGFAVEEETQPTMVAKGPGAVAQPFGFDPAASRDIGQYFLRDCGNTIVNGTCPGHHNGVATPVYSSSKASFFTSAEKDRAGTLVATDYKDPPLINEQEYTVRRLTPTECARLQGFPDWWCDELGEENPSEEEISLWQDIFETHRLITGTAEKPKSKKQIIKWLKNPNSDSAEYKMWGNGVALPCVCFVLSRLVLLHKTEYGNKQNI